MPFLGKVPSQLVDSDVDIDGGSIDGVAIGSVTANAGAFTNLTATGTLTLPDDAISGDDIDGGTISNVAISGTTASFSGDLTVDTNTLYVDSTNNRVGVLNASPSEALDVAGSAKVIRNTGATNTGDQNSIVAGASTTGVSSTSFGAGLQFQVENSSGAYAGSRIVSRLDADNNTANLVFQVRNYGFSDSMTLNSLGNVGIGDINASTRLSVSKNAGNGNAGQLVKITNTNTSSGTAKTLTIGTDNYFAPNPAMTIVAENGLSLGVGDGSDLAAQRAVTINSLKRVGIGEIDPQQALHLGSGGKLRIERPDGLTYSEISMRASNQNGWMEFYNANGDGFAFTDPNGTPLVIDASGGVGIGMTAPSQRNLSLYGTTYSILSLHNPTTGQGAGDGLQIQAVGSDGYLVNYESGGFLGFYTASSGAGPVERLRIDSYGGLSIRSVGGAQSAMFGGSNVVNGITALPSSAGTPLALGRDTGTTRSAHFAGHLKFDSGFGIDFSSTANGPAMLSEVLDDYEEGNWYPTIAGSSGASGQSYSVQVGLYTKIGNTVNFAFDVMLATVGTLSGTYVVLGGLPFQPAGSNVGGGMTVSYFVAPASVNKPVGGYINGSLCYLLETGAGADYLQVSEGKVTNGTRLIGFGQLML